MRNISIEGVLNGWIVKVSCQRLVVTDKDFMLKEIGCYIDNQDEVEKEYMANAVNKTPVDEPLWGDASHPTIGQWLETRRAT